MFDFIDLCDYCLIRLDSPDECKSCEYNPCKNCPYEFGSAACWGNDDCPYNQ